MNVSQVKAQDVVLDIEVKHAVAQGSGVFLVGDLIVFEYSAMNQTTDTIKGYFMNLTLPDNFVVFPGSSFSPSNIPLLIDAIPPGKMVVQETSIYEIISAGVIPVEIKDEDDTVSDQTEIQVLEKSNLQLLKRVQTNYSGAYVVDNAVAGINENLTYELAVYNEGPSDVTGASLEDDLPVGMEFVSASNGGVYDLDNHHVNWSGLSIAAGGTLLIEVEVKALEEGVFTNTANVLNFAQYDEDLADNSSEVGVEVKPLYDLSLTKTLESVNNPPQEGELIEFVLRLSNDDRVVLEGPFEVEDMVPNGYAVIDTDLDPQLSYDVDTGLVRWVYPDNLELNESVEVRFQAQVRRDGAGVDFVNTATITSATDLDTDLGNNSSSTGGTPTENLTYKDLAVFQRFTSSYGDERANVGEELQFDLIVLNTGLVNLGLGTVLEISLPDGLALNDYDISKFTYDSDTSVLTTTLDTDIATFNFLSFNYTAIVQDAASSYDIVAEIIIEDDLLANNKFSNSIEAVPVADLEIVHSYVELIDGDGELLVGEQVQFDISLTNQGPSISDLPIEVYHDLPLDALYIASEPEGVYDEDLHRVSWSVEAISKDEILVFNVVAELSQSGNLSSRVEVLPLTTLDLDLSNNLHIISGIEVFEAVDVEVSQVINTVENPVAGDQIQVLISVLNRGPNQATNLTLENYIPDGYQVDVASITGSGVLSGTSIIWNLASLDGNEVAQTFEFTAELISPADSYYNGVELVACDQVDIDSSPEALMADHPDDLEDDESLEKVNFLPLAVDDSYEIVQGVQGDLEVLWNDSFGLDGPGDPLMDIVVDPVFGSVNYSLGVDGVPSNDDYFIYTANTGFYGEDSFTYVIYDSDGDSSTALVSLVVLEDVDGDGVVGDNDLDSDNDGILNVVEGTLDRDGDGVVDSLDLDSDGDGILDVYEAQGGGELIEASGLYDANGIDLAFGTGLTPIDTDGDGIPNYLDLDSDGDSVLDAIENWDLDSDGIADVVSSSVDLNFDGVDDVYSKDIVDLIDTDFDGLYDYIDVDDDGDGMLTSEEDLNADGDLSNDDCDLDGVVDYLDPDSCSLDIIKGISPNGDGTNDVFEIEGLQNLYPEFEMRIMDRWGGLVFKYKHNGSRTESATWWDGTDMKGKAVQEGTYYYILDYNSGSKKSTKDWVFVKW